MRSIQRKVISVLIIMIMITGVVLVDASNGVYAATSYKLVNKVICYTKDGKSWKKTGVIEFSYNKKGDVVKRYRSKDEYANGSETTYTYAYTYKNGKKVKAKEYLKKGNGSKRLVGAVDYDKNGREKSYSDLEELFYSGYKYGKNGYLTDIDGDDYDNIKFYYRWNGKKPESIVTIATGYWGMYTRADYNKKGLIEKTQCNKNLMEGDRTFEYSYINGLVKTVKINVTKDDKYSTYKYVLKYADKKTDVSTYRAMINYITCRATTYTGTTIF